VIEPLLEEQALSGISKTWYQFIPSDTEPENVAKIIPNDKDLVEGYGDSEVASPYIMSLGHIQGHVKVMPLTSPKHSMSFWQQPTVIKELEETLKSRLNARGEKLAKTEKALTDSHGDDNSYPTSSSNYRSWTASYTPYHQPSVYPQPSVDPQPWHYRSFQHGETLSAGFTGVEVILETKHYDLFLFSFVSLYIEVA
jgi:hypothetical protein